MTDALRLADVVGGAATGLTAEIVSAYVTHNSMPAAELPALIRQVHAALMDLGRPPVPVELPPVRQPAVPVKKSITEDYLVCLEDGRKFKSLRRHLQSAYGLSPEAYRERWGLPADYPMVAASYSAQRAALARAAGAGAAGDDRPAGWCGHPVARDRRRLSAGITSPATTGQPQENIMAKPIGQATEILAILEDGTLNADVSREIQRTLEALQDVADPSGKRKVKGSVTLKITFAVSGRQVEIEADIASKTPKASRSSTFMFITPDHKLSTDHPSQQQLEFGPREVRAG